jgi:predicted enzyme related to lactoylglutathione lyase
MAAKKNRKAPRGRKPRRAAAKSRSRRRTPSPPRHTPTRGLFGWITHTELASADPDATRAWCASVLGWTFKPSFPTPAGAYHLFAYSDKGGGGIRRTNPAETPGSTPVIHVADTDASFAKALREGAEAMMPPETVMPGVRIAIVRAPGGVVIGFSGPSDSHS